MNNLPKVVSQEYLRHYWWYRDKDGHIIALVVRYEQGHKAKKWFRQYQINENGEWVEGAATPSSLFGLNTLPDSHYPQTIYIFEGEKCTQAAHYLGLPAITSMFGSNAAHKADWKSLEQFPHLRKFVLVPDNDDSGKKFMEVVASEIRRVIPEAAIHMFSLPCTNKGDDFVDWVKTHEHCPKDWDEFNPIGESYLMVLRKAFEDLVENGSVLADTVFKAEHKQEKPEFIEPPEPLDEVLLPVDPCPIQTLPKVILEWVDAVSQQMQVPVDFVAVPLLVAAGSLIGRKRGLLLRQGTNWVEHANVWGMIVGQPSVMKSPCMKAALQPLFELAEKASNAFSEELKEYEGKARESEIAKKVVDETIKAEMKKNVKSAPIKLGAYSNLGIEELPEAPKQRRYIIQDSTVEKLGELMRDNPQGLLLYRDELSGWLYGFEKTGRENDRQFYLESWSGKESFNVDRISRGSIYVPAMCLSVIGSIQPGPLARYIRNAIKGGIGDDGFIQRFQLVAWPDQLPKWELVVKNNIPDLEKSLEGICWCINHLEFDIEEKPLLLSFTEEAQASFDAWQHNYENRLRQGSLPAYLEAHLAKYKKLKLFEGKK